MNLPKLISRPSCVLTGKPDIQLVHSFKQFPIYMGCVNKEDSNNDMFCDMDWGVSTSSGSLQLMNLLDPSLLYKEHHNPGTIGKIWQQHHKKFHDFINKSPFQNVLEIGGASGSLINLFLPKLQNFNWTIIEPSTQKCTNDPRVKFIQEFFEDYNFDQKFDAVVHSHLFEHIYNPMTFLDKVYNILEDGGNHYITMPNLRHWVEQGYLNALMLEHTLYIDETVIEYMLNTAGFEIVDKIIEPHSIFVHCKKVNKVTVPVPDLGYIKEMFTKFTDNLNASINTIKTAIGDHQVYLFGGHVFSQYLLNAGLPESQIVSILDNDPKKHNMRLYGTNLIVTLPSCLIDLDQPIVVLRGGPYTNEIKESLLKINPTTIFV